MTVTLDLDEEIVKRARKLAKRRGTSLETMIGDYLRDEVTSDLATTPIDEVIKDLEELWATNGGHSGGRKWTREEMHERKDVP
jgi:predicted transcriptional regulator